ncbi:MULTISPECIES: hypothetical protein [unclassified Methylocystis]|nr:MULTISPECIES: hypothetical protein [unclassified Methylocystis]MBL1256715.1 hypothetical protein [Methylocystis sp. Sn-Cys]MDJ0450470.1 hypothetical protein [Methylocystis sp. JR02]
MRQTAGLGALLVVFLVLALELAGAGAYVVSSAHADASDFCFGYALCR